MLLRYTYNHQDAGFNNELDLIQTTLKKLDAQKTVQSLMGSEGIATAAYFRAFGRMFRQEFSFTERTRRPPKDPVNALLSFGYTLLTNEILSLLVSHGFDPYIGFLHGIVYGRPSLALDLVEEFRHPIIDRFTLSLMNQRVLQPRHFRTVENGGIYLTEEGMKIFFRHYEQLMRRPLAGEKPTITLRSLFKRQVRQMGATIKNRTPYKPFSWRI